MTSFLTVAHLRAIADEVCEGTVVVRDHGLLESALARPRATAFGADAYPSVFEKAAALMHSLCTNHALVDGNKRLAIGAAMVFLDINDAWQDRDVEDLFELTMAVADGSLSDVAKIADRLRAPGVTETDRA